MTIGTAGTPEPIAQRIRDRGAVLDMALTQSLYRPLLAEQPRDGVRVVTDLAYGEDARHRLDLYQPLQPSTRRRPLLLFLPGGGFIRGDKAERENVGQYFARHGYVVAVANYRLGPEHRWPAGAEDAISAYRWARDHAALYGADAGRLIMAGESAGAAHVAAAALIRRFHPAEGLKVAGLALISGVYDVQLEKLARRQFDIESPDPRNESYFGTRFDDYPLMSTISLIDVPPLPLFLSYAELDLLQMQVQAGALFSRLVTQHGFEPELRVIPGHNHLTQVFAINTGDETLSAPLRAFLDARTTHSVS